MKAEKFVKRLARNVLGATAVEYGVLLALIALVILGSVQAVGGATSANLTDVADQWVNAS